MPKEPLQYGWFNDSHGPKPWRVTNDVCPRLVKAKKGEKRSKTSILRRIWGEMP
jgi:hypothetical protein